MAITHVSALNGESPPAKFRETDAGTGPSGATSTTSAPQDAKSTGKVEPPEQYVAFESFILSAFIENMLPKNTETVFGKGVAGSTWKSMLSDVLGAQLAKSGGVGIAESLLKADYNAPKSSKVQK